MSIQPVPCSFVWNIISLFLILPNTLLWCLLIRKAVPSQGLHEWPCPEGHPHKPAWPVIQGSSTSCSSLRVEADLRGVSLPWLCLRRDVHCSVIPGRCLCSPTDCTVATVLQDLRVRCWFLGQYWWSGSTAFNPSTIVSCHFSSSHSVMSVDKQGRESVVSSNPSHHLHCALGD